ncbi:MAG: PAS domain S-box protein [Prolixibacteraceae bacterium]
MKKLLLRQIKRHFGSPDKYPEEFKAFLEDINATYQSFDDDIYLLQNSIEISSVELRNAFEKHKQDAEKQRETIQKIKEAIYAIKPITTNSAINNELSSSDTSHMFDSLLKLIEESKHADKEIRKLSQAVEQNPASIVITDIKGNIEYVNPTFCTLTGYTKEEVIGKNPRILKTETTGSEVYAELWKTILAGNEWKGEFHNRKKNGELYWELASISSVKNNEGEILNFLAIKEDITKRKATEETLENERALFRTIIDLIPDAVYVKDTLGRKILANPKDVEFAEKNSEKDLLGKTDAELYSSAQAQHSYEEDLFVLQSGKPLLNNEGTLLDQNNVLHSLLTSKVPLYDLHGNITGLVGVTHDITERKIFEEALQSKTSLLEAQTDATIDGILVIDNNQKRVLINQRAIELFKIPQHLLENEDDSIMLQHVVGSTKYPEKFIAKVKYLYEHVDEISQDEIEFKDGMILDRYSAPVLGKDGKNYGRIWTFRDITKTKQSEAELQSAHKSLSDILNAAIHTCIISTNTDGLITAFSKGAEKMLGYSAEEMIGKETPACLHIEREVNEHASFLSQTLNRKIEGFEIFVAMAKIQEHEERTWTYVRKDGTSIFVNLIVSAIRDNQQNIIGFLGVASDITERKKATEEVKRVSMRLALATSAGGVGVWDLDILNNDLIWDSKMHELYGVEKKNFDHIYSKWLSTLHPDDLERTNDEIQQAIEGIKDFDTEFKVCWPDDSIHNIRAMATILRDESGKAVRMIGTNWDITEQKKTEAILQKARQDAESANKAKSEFLANVSHEIRTPMNAIIGFSEILLDKITDFKLKEHLKTILSSGRTLLSLINDILDLSKIEAGRLEVEYEAMHYTSLVKDIEQLFLPKIQQKGLSFEIINHPDVPDYIYMDEIRFHQILFNLVGNAIKFTQKGFIRVETNVKPDQDDNKITLVIEIEDTGIGIPNDQLESIFEAFTQQSGQSNRQFEGTGLGLAITKRLIEKMNGEISVQSRVGRGSIFTILFKSIEIAHLKDVTERSMDKIENKINFLPAKILIVDDIDFNIQVVENMLDFAEFKFISANSGEKALELLEFERPDIIFMDIRMHGMSGISTTEIIKQNEALKHIPVIAFTASALQNQMDLINGLFNGYVGKPISKKALINTLKEHLKYTIGKAIEQEKSNKISDLIISTECSNKIPELLVILERDYLDEWKEISGNLIIFEIEDFCIRLKELNTQFQCNILEIYVNKLSESIQTFDVELIEKNVNEFEELILVMRNFII